MAINSKKISALTQLTSLTGEEYLMVAYNNKSYKIKTSLLTSDIIKSITQQTNDGDGADNPITITTANGQKYTFSVKNGQKGSQGEQGVQGEKGETGDTGVAIYNTDVSDMIVNTVNGKDADGEDYTDSELINSILSANMGVYLNDKLDALAEVYCTQDEYDALAASNKVSNATKYFIIDSE